MGKLPLVGIPFSAVCVDIMGPLCPPSVLKYTKTNFLHGSPADPGWGAYSVPQTLSLVRRGSLRHSVEHTPALGPSGVAIYYLCFKKRGSELMSITLSNLNRFSNFFSFLDSATNLQ